MIFIRATVVRDSEELAGATAEKYRYIQQQQALRKEKGLRFLNNDYIPELPLWEDQVKQLEQMQQPAEPAVPESE